MKKFNLDLAKQGHPLCFTNGIKVTQFEWFDKLSRGVFTTNIPYTHYYAQYDGYIVGTREEYLMLDDSIPWVEEPKMGDTILVKDNDKSSWNKRIFIKKGNGDRVLCVAFGDNDDYMHGHTFNTTKWDKWKWPEPNKEITVDIKINGLSIKTTDITEINGIINITANTN